MAVSFATADDVFALLRIASPAADLTAAANAAVEDASASIRAYTRQTISSVDGDQVTLRGNWTNSLWLPQRPVRAVNSVVIRNGSIFVDDIPLHEAADYRWDRLGLLRRVSYITGRLLAPASGFWGGDQAVVEVNYDHGYDDNPADIRAMCRSIAIRLLSNPTGELREDIGNYAVMHGRTMVSELTEEEKAQLRDYRRHPAQISLGMA